MIYFRKYKLQESQPRMYGWVVDYYKGVTTFDIYAGRTVLVMVIRSKYV